MDAPINGTVSEATCNPGVKDMFRISWLAIYRGRTFIDMQIARLRGDMTNMKATPVRFIVDQKYREIILCIRVS